MSEEEEQFDDDIRWLQRRKDELKIQFKERPNQIKAQYQIKGTHIYPLGLLYIIPQNLVNAYA